MKRKKKSKQDKTVLYWSQLKMIILAISRLRFNNNQMNTNYKKKI